MTTPTPFPWGGAAIMLVTILVMIGGILLVLKVIEWVAGARYSLRYRYCGGQWRPAAIDLLGVPIWCALEIVCLVAGVTLALIVGILMYQAAKDVRDWWHAGDRERR